MRDVNNDDWNNQNENQCFERQLWGLTRLFFQFCGRISHCGRIQRHQASLKTLLCAASARTLSQLCLKSLVMVFDRSWSWIGGSYSLTEFYYTGLGDRPFLLLLWSFEKRFVMFIKRTSKVPSIERQPQAPSDILRGLLWGQKSTRERWKWTRWDLELLRTE